MTAQIPDTINWSGKTYNILASTEPVVFDLRRYLRPLKPKMFSTACYRGYVASFALDAFSQFVIKHVTVNSPEVCLQVNDAPPYCIYTHSKGLLRSSATISFDCLDLKIPVDGTLRACWGFINDMYVHMGFQHFTSFLEVVDLHFEKGILVYSKDLSTETALLRSVLRNEAARHGKKNYAFASSFFRHTKHPEFVAFREKHEDF